MSGFDFDALRDPVAPQPGDRERAGVHARARRLQGRARRARVAAGATSLVAIVVVVLVAVAATRTTGPSITVEGPGTSLPPTTTPNTYGPSTAAGGFIPSTTLQNGRVVLPVTLPDGETFTMDYPPSLKVAQLGFAGGINVGGKQVTISYTTVQHEYGDQPVHVYPGANGSQVSMFHANQRTGYVGPDVDVLVYQFGHWLAVVEAPAGAADQARWARSLSGTADANDYLVLHSDSLAIGKAFDGGFGKVPGNNLELAAHLYCGQPGSDGRSPRIFTNGDGSNGVSWCDGELHVSAGGAKSFWAVAATSLHVGPLVSPAGTSPVRPPSTTTTLPRSLPNSSPAVSASWVSLNHGWALELSGSIAETTDGGTTWRVTGTLGKGNWQGVRIRFFSGADGFAFEPGVGGSLKITHDAGATWINLDTPFAAVYDLAVLRGMIYAVGMPPTNSGSFGIWATPIAHLVWKRDPLSLPIGAGPVPTEQLALSGTGGWILNVDRTVISGARLSANHWTAWNPPCLGKNGPAFLAAPTSTDLVATCNEGVWGPPKQATTVYFSHDGGTTFVRRAAPGFGPVAAASPDTAVIGGNGRLWRTTDDGKSWAVVAKFDNKDAVPSDLGFTTATQGFVVVQNDVLMTHDAGASWQAVTLP